MLSHLLSILDDLHKHHKSKSEVMQECINKRLNDSIKSYYDELAKSCEFLQKKNELKVMKKMIKD